MIGPVGLGYGAQHGAMVQLFHGAGVNVAGVPGVGEPDAAQGVNGQVVGGVQRHAVQVVGNGGSAAVAVEADNGPPVLAAAEEVALGVKGEAVGEVGVFAEHGKRARAGVVGVDAAGVDVGEKHRFPVPGGAFGNPARRVFKAVEEAEAP